MRTVFRSGFVVVSQALIVLTTCASAPDAEALATALVEERLAACVNVLPAVASIYRWDGRIHRDQESMLVIKTTTDRFEAVERAIQSRSSYELPEVLAIAAERGSAAYLKWLSDAIGTPKE